MSAWWLLVAAWLGFMAGYIVCALFLLVNSDPWEGIDD